jgi:hypothetical protein
LKPTTAWLQASAVTLVHQMIAASAASAATKGGQQ